MLYEKGYKPYKRWEWQVMPRLLSDGSLPGLAMLAEAAERNNRMRIGNKDFSLNSWVPVGPFEVPPSLSPYPIHDIGRINCIAFHPTDPDIFWVGAPQGGIWKTTDGGQNWMPLGDQLPVMKISDIAVDPADPDVMYISICDYGYMAFFIYYFGRPTAYGLGIYKTTDGGQTWAPTGLTYTLNDKLFSMFRRVFIHPVNHQSLLAAGVDGIYGSDDGGVTWTEKSGVFVWDIEQDPSDFQTLYATTCDWYGGICGVMKSTDFGGTWLPLETGIPKNDTVVRIEVALAPSDPDVVYATCSAYDEAFYAFYRSVDGGATWSKQADSSQLNLFGQTNGDPSNKLAQASYDLWLWVDPSDPDKVYSGAMNIWGSENGGLSWNICSFGIHCYGQSIHFDHHYIRRNPLDNKIYLTCDGGLYRTDEIVMGNLQQFDSCWSIQNLTTQCYEFPTQWENLSDGLVITEFYRLALSRNTPGYVLAGSQDNCIYFRNPQEEWVNLTSGDGMECMIHPDNPDIIYASNQFGYLWRSLNGGLNMGLVTGYLLNQEGQGAWVTPFVMDQEQPETIYAGFRNLWRSDNQGAVWNKISQFPNMPGSNLPLPVWDIALAPGNPDVIYLSKQPYPAAGIGYPGQMWKTVNGGQDWVNITGNLPVQNTFINDITVGENPEQVYVVCSGWVNGMKVYRSANGGQAWENITGNLPNIPVSSIVLQEGSTLNDLYLGTDIGVYYRNDNYNDWELYSDNLPNIVINELEISYPENMIYAATYGRGIWKAPLMNPVTSVSRNPGLKEAEMSIFPNPANDQAFLEVTARQPGIAEVEVLDILGTVVYQTHLQYFDGKTSLSLPVREWVSGLYFVTVAGSGVVQTCRLLVNR